MDREDWVPASELQIGERLLDVDGSTPAVESFVFRAEPEAVYNREVEGEHCYRVRQQRLLVYSQLPGQQQEDTSQGPCPLKTECRDIPPPVENRPVE